MMKRFLAGLAVVMLALGAVTITRAAEMAPEIARPGLKWFNVAAPLPIAALRGRVVILDFWTEGCINCIHIIPTLRRIELAFPDKVVVIGVHSPKFANERDPTSVQDAIERYGIVHPIVHDPKLSLWQAYDIPAWPTLVVIDTDGSIVGQVVGEPDPDGFLATITKLVNHSAQDGMLKPVTLNLTAPVLPTGAFLFPGKLKALPGKYKQWVLADGGHNQIVTLDDAGHVLGRYGSGAVGHDDGPGNLATFNHPQGLIATASAIYVADTSNHLIRRIDHKTGMVTTIAGTGKRGRDLGAPEPALATALASPWDLEAQGELIYFANAGTHQIGVLDLKTATVARLAGTGAEALTTGPAATAAFAQPSGLALSPDGNTLYVADSESSAVRAITLGENPMVSTLVGAGLFDFGWTNGTLKNARLQHPLGVAADGGRILVADSYNSALRVIDPKAGDIADFDGGAYTCMDKLCIPTREPAGIVADGPDRVLVVDTGNQRIEEYRPSKKTYHTWAR